MRKKKKTTLPRVTLMAFDRRALLAFCESVESLRLLVDDLRIVVGELKVKLAAKKKQPAPQPAPVFAPMEGVTP